MKNGLYVFYNKLSMRYGQVFVSATDAVASKNAGLALDEATREETELCKIGEIDISTGIAECHAPERLEIRVQKLPLSEAKTEPPKTI